MEEMKPKRGRPRKEVTTTPKPARAKKGNQGRPNSNKKATTMFLTEELRDELREIADKLEAQTGEKYSLHRTVNHLKIFYVAVTETQDGEL